MASGDMAMIASIQQVLGVGRLRAPTSGLCLSVDFHGHHDWELRSGEALLLRTQFGRPQLPHEALSPERFADNIARLFPQAGEAAIARLWSIFLLQCRRGGGSLLVVAEDAQAEAHRLRSQATPVTPVRLCPEVLDHACRIDGGLLVDPSGDCYAIGVILDGPASEACTPSRGARYNSAVRYVHAAPVARMAIVVSDDRSVDVVPLLAPRVERALIETQIAKLERATRQDIHAPRAVLDDHRFYLDAGQCERINAAIARIKAQPVRDMSIWWEGPSFVPDPRFNPSYLI